MPSDRTRKRERDRETEGAKRGKASQKGDLGGNRRATVVGCERPARDSPDVATHHLLQKVLDKICQVSRVVWILVVRLLRERRAPVKETTGDKSDAKGVSDHLRALSRQRTRHPTRFPLGAKLKGILLTPTQRVRIRARLSRAAEGVRRKARELRGSHLYLHLSYHSDSFACVLRVPLFLTSSSGVAARSRSLLNLGALLLF